MRFLGQTEFNLYLFAQEEYGQLINEQRFLLYNAYLDVQPTLTNFAYDVGRVYSRSCNVEEYAIHIIDLREEMKKDREKIFNRLVIYKKAITLLEPDELNLVTSYKSNVLVQQNMDLIAALNKLRSVIETTINAKTSFNSPQNNRFKGSA